MFIETATLTIIALLSIVWIILRKKQMHLWIADYLIQAVTKKKEIEKNRPLQIMFCFVDHFEPQWKKASYEDEIRRVKKWVEEYPRIAQKFKDADGRYPQHTFFYPAEEYRPEHLEKLAKLCKEGFGDVEVHLHHDNDTAEGLRQKIEEYKEKLTSHGLLSHDKNGKIRYGFIHGNWALDNSRRDGKRCGVNNELQILRETGCYADFTLPSAPSETQTSKINSIYYATDDPQRPKSHNTGIDVAVGKKPKGDLLIVQGPLAFSFRRKKFSLLPSIENSEISYGRLPSESRIDLWIAQKISVIGKPDWIFVKVYTHGAQEKNINCLFNGALENMFEYLETEYNDKKKYQLHYLTARETYNIIKAAEEGKALFSPDYRDHILKPNI